MKILKFKKISSGKYKILLDNKEYITLYEDVIIKNELLLNKEINEDLLDDLLKQNNNISAYENAINYISFRMRSIKEIREYLIKKNISENVIEETIKRLLNEGYLNDESFAKAYYKDKLTIGNSGPLKIEKELIKHGIRKDTITSVSNDVDTYLVKNKLSKLINKQMKIKKDSANSLKLKLINYFVNLGYDKQMILEELSNYEFKSDQNKLKRDYDKLYNKYKEKYEGSKLDYFIAQKLYSKGYTSEDIIKITKEKRPI